MPPNDHVAVRLERDGVNGCLIAKIGVEARIVAAVGVQAHHAIEGVIIEIGEPASHHDLAVGQDEKGTDPTVGPGTDVEAGILTAIGIQTNQSAAGNAVVIYKIPAHEDLPIGLHRDRKDEWIIGVALNDLHFSSSAWVKRGIERAIRVQASDAVARNALDIGEPAADDDLAVRK